MEAVEEGNGGQGMLMRAGVPELLEVHERYWKCMRPERMGMGYC